MTDARELQFQKLVQDFPNSPMGHFSLGRHYLEGGRFADAAAALARAVELDGTYVAAMVALGDAQVGAGQTAQARETFIRSREIALSQHHEGLAEEIDERLEDLG